MVPETSLRTSPQSYREVLSKYAEGDVILDHVGFYRPVAAWLDELGLDVHLAAASKIPKPRV